jgi:hypothetical protein
MNEALARVLGDFSKKSCHLACVLARLPCCAKGYIALAMRPFARLAGRRKSCAMLVTFFRQCALEERGGLARQFHVCVE